MAKYCGRGFGSSRGSLQAGTLALHWVDQDKWWDTSVSLGRASDSVSCYLEPILLENGEDSPIYREVMRTGVIQQATSHDAACCVFTL